MLCVDFITIIFFSIRYEYHCAIRNIKVIKNTHIYFKLICWLSVPKGLICPCSTKGVGKSSWLSILIRILLLSGKEHGGDLRTSPFWGDTIGVCNGEEYGTYILKTSGLGAWGVALGVEWDDIILWVQFDIPIPDPTELAPPADPSDMLLWVSRLFSCAWERVIVENTDRSAVDVTLVSASERFEPPCWHSSKDEVSSMLGSNENFDPIK